MVTNPNWMAPFHIARATALNLVDHPTQLVTLFGKSRHGRRDRSRERRL